MNRDNGIATENRYMAFVIMAAYIILFILLLPQRFIPKESIDTSNGVIAQEDKQYTYINGVPLINQFPELPTGCEVTSVAMLLNFYSINVSKNILADEVVKTSLPQFKNGRYEGESPHKYFIGSPKSDKAFGVFNEPIFNLISRYKSAQNITGCEFEEVIEQIKDNKPVMVWITRELEEVEYTSSWYVNDEIYWWPKGEHTVIITGIDETTVIVNDPYDGKEKRYELNRFKYIWELMGRQAIVIVE